MHVVLSMKRLLLICMLAGIAVLAAAAVVERRSIAPAGIKPVGPYSPGVFAGDYLYISGQGPRDAQGQMPASPEAQVRLTFDNIRSVVEAAGLTMEHLVYVQVYLKSMDDHDALQRVWREVFPKEPPARAVLGVHSMPTGVPVEINAVAIRNLANKKVVAGGVLTHDRMFLSGSFGKPGSGDPAFQVQQALDGMKQALADGGLDFRHMVFVNPYLTREIPMEVMNRVYAKHFEYGNTPARATIVVSSLPETAGIEFTGVAVRDLSQRRAVRPKNMAPSPTASPCVFAADTYYCSAKAGFIPGPNGGIFASTVEHQLRQTMRNLLDGLEETDLDFSHVVATNVYLDDMEDFGRMNAVYALYFPGIKPARTTVAQLPPAERKPRDGDRWPTLEQISLVAVK